MSVETWLGQRHTSFMLRRSSLNGLPVERLVLGYISMAYSMPKQDRIGHRSSLCHDLLEAFFAGDGRRNRKESNEVKEIQMDLAKLIL